MYTETRFYRSMDLYDVARSIGEMESNGWNVRQILILEPVIEVKKELPVGSPRQTVKVISLLVVYERESI